MTNARSQYDVKNISRAQLAEMWVAKYFPNHYLMIAGDDTGVPTPANLPIPQPAAA